MIAGTRAHPACRTHSTMPRRTRAAFTLIELLVVVSVIALLISITMPSLSAARRISKRAICGTNLHSIGTAIQAYLTAHNDWYPRIAQMPSSESVVAAAEGRRPYPAMPKGLAREVGQSTKVFRCPADKNTKQPDLETETYFESEGTSFEWNPWFSGRRVGRDGFTSGGSGPGLHLGLSPSEAWMVSDFEAYHGGLSQIGSLNILYADFHVAPDKEKVNP